MPTYQYRCKECGHDFEIVQAFTDDALTTCPECEKSALKKVYGNVGISFKGSGFYKNDARSSGTSKVASKDDTAASTKSESTTSEKKTDTKSEKKTEAKASSTTKAD